MNFIPSLVIVLPIFNEAEALPGTLSAWKKILDNIPRSVLLALNDGSTDKTKIILEKEKGTNPGLVVIHKFNSGHGDTILEGYRWAFNTGCPWIFQADSDSQIPVDSFWELWKSRDKSPFVLGVRRNRKDPWFRKVISLLNRGMAKLLFGVSIPDPNIPFRLMSNPVLRHLMGRLDFPAFAPNIMLSVLAAKEKIDPLNIPVPHERRASGKTTLKPLVLARVCLRSAGDLWKLRKTLAAP